ncbi:MAG: DUF3052 family protein [Steroidobacteraceae bacterium]
MPTGYSGTPLAKKLGIKTGSTVYVKNAPDNYAEWLEPLPEGVKFVARAAATTDVLHMFTMSKTELAKTLAAYRKQIKPEAMIWVSWPKKSAKMDSDVTEDVIREIALPLGLVDIKVCAVNETWSGLKLVIRKALR